MIYSCIDIGSDTIKFVVGKIKNDNISILASTCIRSSGIKKGIIVDKELVCKTINLGIDELEKVLGFRIDKAIINVPFYDVLVNVYNGKCYPGGEIGGDDVITCFKSCVSTIDVTEEVISVCPINFLIDDEKKTMDPKGETGEKLECKMLISTIPKRILYPILEVFEKCNIEIIDLSFGVINDFYNVNRKDYNDVCGAIVDIGSDKTEVAIFNKGLMVNGTTLPLGSRLVDNDISYIYHLDKTSVRNIKENFAYSSSQYASHDENMEFEGINNDIIKINQYEVSQVMEARVEEILKSVKKTINDLTKHEISYIIIAGGITNSQGFDYLLGILFGDIASVVNINLVGVRNNIYTSCVGMLKYYYDKLNLRGIGYTMYDDIPKELDSKKNVLHEKIIDDMKKYLENN